MSELEVGLSVDGAVAVTETIRQGAARALEALSDVESAVRQAYEGRAWAALGYESWEAYCGAEFDGARLWSSVEERHARTLALRDAGLSQRAIAAVLGTSVGTTNSDLSTVQDRTVDSAMIEGLDGRSRPAERGVPEVVLARRVEAASLRDAGFSQVAIAEKLGVSQPTVSMDLRAVENMSARSQGPVLTVEDVLLGFDVSELPPARDLGRLAAAGLRDLRPVCQYVHDQVVFADEWVQDEQAQAAVRALVPGLADMLLIIVACVEQVEKVGVERAAGAVEGLRWSQTLTQAVDMLERAAA